MRVLIFDLESTDLAASWGRILCSSFATLDQQEAYTFRGDKGKWKGSNAIDDSKLAVAVRGELEKSDIVIGWNSILFDVPLLNARLSLAGERKVQMGEKYGTWHLDLMYYAGGQSMRIGGKRLDTIAKFFGCQVQKTPLDGNTWQLAAAGDKPAMDLVVQHCEHDVLVVKELWPKLAPFVSKFQFPLSDVWPFINEIPSRRDRGSS